MGKRGIICGCWIAFNITFELLGDNGLERSRLIKFDEFLPLESDFVILKKYDCYLLIIR